MSTITLTGATEIAVTVKAFAKLPTWPSVSVTLTVRGPTTAVADIAMLIWRLLLELYTQVFTVTPRPKSHCGFPRKFEPVMVTLRLCPGAPPAGLTPVTIGAGLLPATGPAVTAQSTATTA
jgi:hypothetical protein